MFGRLECPWSIAAMLSGSLYVQNWLCLTSRKHGAAIARQPPSSPLISFSKGLFRQKKKGNRTRTSASALKSRRIFITRVKPQTAKTLLCLRRTGKPKREHASHLSGRQLAVVRKRRLVVRVLHQTPQEENLRRSVVQEVLEDAA